MQPTPVLHLIVAIDVAALPWARSAPDELRRALARVHPPAALPVVERGDGVLLLVREPVDAYETVRRLAGELGELSRTDPFVRLRMAVHLGRLDPDGPVLDDPEVRRTVALADTPQVREAGAPAGVALAVALSTEVVGAPWHRSRRPRPGPAARSGAAGPTGRASAPGAAAGRATSRTSGAPGCARTTTCGAATSATPRRPAPNSPRTADRHDERA